MSSSWTLGVVDNSGVVTACYVNFAAYDAWTAARALAQRYSFEKIHKEILRGQREGGIRYVYADDGAVETYFDYRGERSDGNRWAQNHRDKWQTRCLLIREDNTVIVGWSL